MTDGRLIKDKSGNIQIQIHKYTNTHTKIQIHKHKYKYTNTQIRLTLIGWWVAQLIKECKELSDQNIAH